MARVTLSADDQTKQLLAKIWTRISELTTKAINHRDKFTFANFKEQLGLKMKVKAIQKNCTHKLTEDGGFCTVCGICMWD